MNTLEKIDDLIKQATTEKSHYYTANVLSEAKHRIELLEYRWKALRKWIHSNPNWSVMATTRDVEIHKAMTEITRKIK